MASIPLPLSRTTLLLHVLMVTLVIFIPYMLLRSSEGLITSHGDEVNAYIGVYAMMLVAAMIAGFASLIFFLFKRWRTGLFCVTCVIGLILTAQCGRAPCTQTFGKLAYDCVLGGESHHFVWDKDAKRGRGGRRSVSLEARHEALTWGMYFLAITGCIGFVGTGFLWHNARRSIAWPDVEGQVIHAKVTRYAARAGQPRWNINWSWSIRYRYRVDGRGYEGVRAYFGVEPTFAVASNIVNRFPASSTVRIYYHPHRHDRSVLLPGVNKFTRSAFLVPVIFWSIAILLWLYR